MKADDIRHTLGASKSERHSQEWERLFPPYEIAAQLATLNEFLRKVYEEDKR